MKLILNFYVCFIVFFVHSNRGFASILCKDLQIKLETSGYLNRTVFNEHKNNLANNRFILNRSLTDYQDLLKLPRIPKLEQFIENVNSRAGIWLDIGAGFAFPMRDLLDNNETINVKMIATTYKKLHPSFDVNEDMYDYKAIRALDEDIVKYKDNFQYLETGFIEDSVMDSKSELYKLRGKVDFLTEVWGPINYTHDLQKILNVYADLLKVGGTALIHFDESRATILIGQKRVLLRDLIQLFPILTGGRLMVKESGMRCCEMKGSLQTFDVSVFEIVKMSEFQTNLFPILQTTITKEGKPPERIVKILNPKYLSQVLGEKIQIDRSLEIKKMGFGLYNLEILKSEIFDSLIEKDNDILNNFSK
jgi:SAM-dependent methyltransferase